MDPMDETLEELIDEVDGYIAYFEDVPSEWLRPGEARLTRIAERLRKLKESLDK
ncbi:MAG TPA: hypothetical protein VLT35_07765 [Methanocella sp.]|nr:hypothetical protein [Methanocella sp.]